MDDPPAAVEADELLDRARTRVGRRYDRQLTADALEAWLAGQRLAEQTPAGLVPTARGVELGGGLDEISRDTGRGR